MMNEKNLRTEIDSPHQIDLPDPGNGYDQRESPSEDQNPLDPRGPVRDEPGDGREGTVMSGASGAAMETWQALKRAEEEARANRIPAKVRYYPIQRRLNWDHISPAYKQSAERLEVLHQSLIKNGIYRLVGEPVPESLTRRKEIEILQSLSEYLRMILRSENERARTLMELLGEERYVERRHEPIYEADEYNLECDHVKAILAPDGLGTMKEYKYKLKNIDKIWKRYQLFELLGVPKPNQTPTVGEMVNLRKKMTAFVVGEELSTENRKRIIIALEQEIREEEEKVFPLDGQLEEEEEAKMQFISVKDIIPEEVTFRSKDDKNMVLVKVRAVSASFHRKTTMGEPTNGIFPLAWKGDAMFVSMATSVLRRNFPELEIVEPTVVDDDIQFIGTVKTKRSRNGNNEKKRRRTMNH